MVVDPATHEQLMSIAEEDPDAQIMVDLANQTITLPDGRKVTFPIDGFSKHMLTEGVDELGYTLAKSPEISRFEQAQQFG